MNKRVLFNESASSSTENSQEIMETIEKNSYFDIIIWTSLFEYSTFFSAYPKIEKSIFLFEFNHQ